MKNKIFIVCLLTAFQLFWGTTVMAQSVIPKGIAVAGYVVGQKGSSAMSSVVLLAVDQSPEPKALVILSTPDGPLTFSYEQNTGGYSEFISASSRYKPKGVYQLTVNTSIGTAVSAPVTAPAEKKSSKVSAKTASRTQVFTGPNVATGSVFEISQSTLKAPKKKAPTKAEDIFPPKEDILRPKMNPSH